MTTDPGFERVVSFWSIDRDGWTPRRVDLDVIELGVRAAAAGDVCCHQSAMRGPDGRLRCTDRCGRHFASQDAWIDAIDQAAEGVIRRVTVHGINDKARARA